MTARAAFVRATNTTYWGEGCHPCGGTGKVGRGRPGRGGKAEMSSGPPENGAFVWGTDEGQGGDCMGGPEVPRRLALP